MMNNLKLGVEVVSAHDLMPRDGQGSSNAFVELHFDHQKFRTTVKDRDLNPFWNERFYFNVSDPASLSNTPLEAYVYHLNWSNNSRSLLGKVRLGTFFVNSSDAIVLHYPLEKRGIFSRVRGELGLKVFVTDDLNVRGSDPVSDFDAMTYGPDDAETFTKTIMDDENSTKKADKVNISSKQVEKELVSQSDHLKLQDEQALRSNFTIEDLKDATQNFSNILGKGTYGSVYKGYLGGINVAIKILNPECTEGVLGFKQEVAILTTCRHPYLVTLMGVCYESSALVYEFLPNGSLEDHLTGKNDTSPLTWQVRTRIMCEICVALNFLHSNKPKMVIHGDLKPDNILLDANFRSKLGDFGISRIIERSNTNTTLYYSTRNPVGTFTYMDPEFIMTGTLTEKSDIFAFGVIILRLLTGKSTPGFVYGVEQAMEKGTLDKMIDVSAGKWPFDQAKELAELGLRCVEIKRTDRPNLFNEIWPILERLQRNI